jgi:isopentenyl diphosphate isomerase/L-lactate dehydrogenase-like FMN-dependent dehydrogenase
MVAWSGYQNEIYLAGTAGARPTVPLNPDALEEHARSVLSPEAFAYVAGGAGAERTMAANREALDRRRLVPRHLRSVTERDVSCHLPWATLPAPILLAPIGVLGIVHLEAELAVAEASRATGVGFLLSTVSSHPMEQVATAAGEAPHWFQLYWPRDRDLCASFVHRAEAAGYGAIVVTVDTWQLAWRPRDLQNAYLPFLSGEGLANYLTDPVFRGALPVPPEQDPRPAIQRWTEIFSDPSLSWEDLAWLREQTRLPIILKGIVHADDARRAIEAGVDGIVASNHGGRQVDGAIGALDALPEVVAAVDGRVPVLFDSGIRTGADILKALALGASAVLLGRPYVWALALGGADGVVQLLRGLMAELEISMALCGARSLREVGPELLAET